MNRDEAYEAREKALGLIAEIRLGLPPMLAIEYLVRIRNMTMTAIDECTEQYHREQRCCAREFQRKLKTGRESR